MPPKRSPANGHGLPSSRSARTLRTPAIVGGSRSTATTSSPRAANNFACRPAPLATSSTGPRATSGAQRTTQGEGVSIDACTVLPQQLAQDRAVAARLVLAIAADREVRMMRQRGKQLGQAPRRGGFHFLEITTRKLSPALVRPGLSDRPSEERFARREIRQPEVVVIAPREIRLAHAARRAPHGAEARALAFGARATEPDDANRHFRFPSGMYSTVRSNGTLETSRPCSFEVWM